MMPKDRIIELLRDYKKNHADKYGILTMGVFGSVARGEAGGESDVDICVQTKNPDPYALVHIKEDIENRVQAHVDIIRIREKMNPYLRKRIERDVIYV